MLHTMPGGLRELEIASEGEEEVGTTHTHR